MKNIITQSHIDAYEIATGERPARPEPSLLYVTLVRFFRYAVGLGLLAGAVACVAHFFTTLARF